MKKYLIRIKKIVSFKWLALWTPLFMVNMLPVLTDWLKDRTQTTIQDMVLPLILAVLVSTVLTAVFYHRFKNDRFWALVFAVVLALVSQNFTNTIELIKKYLHFTIHSASYSFFFITLFIVAYILTIVSTRLTRKWHNASETLSKGIIIAVSVTFFIQLFSCARAWIIEWPQFFYRPSQLATQLNNPKSKPDIYYIVLDRYTNENVLKNQFGYDNSDFVNFLGKNGFSVNANAYSNYPYTTMSISSTFNADYHSDLINKFGKAPLQLEEPYHDSIRYSSVIQQLKKIGYSYDALGSWYEATNQAPLADHVYQPEGQLTVFNHTFMTNGFARQQLQESVLWLITSHQLSVGNFTILNYGTIGEADATLYKLNTLKQLAGEQSGSRIIFAHILVPHDPYYFNADGSLAKNFESDNNGKPIKDKYIGQVKFINSQMEEIINLINQNSSNQAMIILQADEGPYPIQLNSGNIATSDVDEVLGSGDMTNWSTQELQMKYGILAAYHLPKVSSDSISDQTSVNIFRVIFNSYFGANLPYLPDCHYALTGGKDKSFIYKEISQKLTGQSNQACASDSNFSTNKK